MKRAEFVGTERKVWDALLKEYIPRSGYIKGNDEEIRILDIGCGTAPEALSLNRYFGKVKREGMDSFDGVEFAGVDIDEKAIESARTEYERPDFNLRPIEWKPEPGFNFVVGDAMNIQALVTGRFDVVVYPHPEILHREEVWGQIMEQSAQLQQSGDLVLVTVRYPGEMATAIRRLSPNYDIKISEENKHRQEGYSVQEGRHKYVIVGIRK